MTDMPFAHKMLRIAKREIKAIRAVVTNPAVSADVADEILGFQFQQAVEKLLKARITSLGIRSRKTHNLLVLLETLTDLGENVDAFRDLMMLNVFAVEMRYDESTEDQPLEREGLLTQVQALCDHVDASINRPSSS